MKRPILSAAIVLLATSAVIATPALAHTAVTKTNIANESHLATSPKTFDVTLEHEASLASIKLTDGAGKERALDFKPTTARKTTFEVPLPTLENGSYKIQWKTVAKDGHVMDGAVSFMVMAH